MIHMLCRNRVIDFSKWHAVFASHRHAHEAAGLRLVRLWRDVANPNDVFFLFEVSDLQKAGTFTSAPEAAEAGHAAGVIEGEPRFLVPADGY